MKIEEEVALTKEMKRFNLSYIIALIADILCFILAWKTKQSYFAPLATAATSFVVIEVIAFLWHKREGAAWLKLKQADFFKLAFYTGIVVGIAGGLAGFGLLALLGAL